jgi:DNA-binding NarL/FixJ family response regulator
VDDHAGFRAAAARLLGSEGFEVVGEAENGVAALRLARELAPDVVLLDVGLPDFDGFEVAERLSHLDPAPAVVLTSSRERTDFGSLGSARGFVAKDALSAVALEALLG